MTTKLKAIILSVFAATAQPSFAFETPTHYDISLAAARISIDDAVRLRLGRSAGLFSDPLRTSGERDVETDFGKVVPQCRHSTPFEIPELVACGAMFEDFYWAARPLFHFLDPQHVDINGYGTPLVRFTAADWALKDNAARMPGNGVVQPQLYSYREAEDDLWTALTFANVNQVETAQRVREEAFGLLFQSLGQIVHLLQDAASPQHTRNEPHFDKLDLGNFSQKSRYEQRALIEPVARWIRYCLIGIGNVPADCTYNVGSAIAPVYPQFASLFQSPRSFWESATRTGLAQITSTSFPSNLNNFLEPSLGHYVPAYKYPLPEPSGVSDIAVADLVKGLPDNLPSFIKSECGGGLETCKMRMLGASLSDPLVNGSLYNDRASTTSLFDQDLRDFNRREVVYDILSGAPIGVETYSKFTINRFNIDRAYSLLIPRAVSYSAGLLNFYFRGEMSIKPPSSGVYSIIDDSDFSPSNPTDVAKGYRGFKTIRLSLANTTPSPGGAPAQKMTNGQLWAVLRFQRNNCYADSLDGLDKQAKPLSDCLSGVEEIVVSDPIDRTGKGREVVPQPTTEKPDGEELEFTLKADLPVNAWNVLLQVVFRGTLGSEENKIAVSTIDLSEPTFFSIFNNTDYVYLGGSCYTPQQVKADPDLWKRVSSACYYPDHAADLLNQFCYNAKYGFHLQNAGAEAPTLTIANESTGDGDGRIPPRRFSRFAMLADGELGADFSFQFWNPTLSIPDDAKFIHISPYHAHKSRTTPGTTTWDMFKQYRGVNAWNGLAFMMDVEKMTIAEDDGASCIGGEGDSLPPLSGEARYPVPSKITFAAP